jgi:IS30 family transposase
MLVKVTNKDPSAIIKQSQQLPSELYRSLTWDRGKELADHQPLTLATEVDVYFCDPRSLTARVKRKHQQIAAPVSSAWRRSVPA